ncbi:uncharacterized protein LOC113377606 isoform X2 [Ctenocephalides felis]|uniref:uncharacterized protein LOC113377606 isoform X2 n=1 Tax=Ctenocephalides felis TaxID=7515 RepID=UPI000E6E23A1|nr:uncharacterized protein LOC113377606 isoform X2 [Ctenocephalides felis]
MSNDSGSSSSNSPKAKQTFIIPPNLLAQLGIKLDVLQNGTNHEQNVGDVKTIAVSTPKQSQKTKDGDSKNNSAVGIIKQNGTLTFKNLNSSLNEEKEILSLYTENAVNQNSTIESVKQEQVSNTIKNEFEDTECSCEMNYLNGKLNCCRKHYSSTNNYKMEEETNLKFVIESSTAENNHCLLKNQIEDKSCFDLDSSLNSKNSGKDINVKDSQPNSKKQNKLHSIGEKSSIHNTNFKSSFNIENYCQKVVNHLQNETKKTNGTMETSSIKINDHKSRISNSKIISNTSKEVIKQMNCDENTKLHKNTLLTETKLNLCTEIHTLERGHKRKQKSKLHVDIMENTNDQLDCSDYINDQDSVASKNKTPKMLPQLNNSEQPCVSKLTTPKRRKTANQTLMEQTEIIVEKRTPRLSKSFTDFCAGKKKKRKRIDSNSSATSDDGNIFTFASVENQDFCYMYITLQSKSNETCDIKCLMCDQFVESNWSLHKLMHNNLVDESSIVSDDKASEQILNDILSKTGILLCEKCCHSENNATSFLNHIKTCSIASKRCCKICRRLYIKVTKDDHAKLHKIHFENLLHKSNKDHDKPNISKLNVPGAKVICACCAKEMNHIDWEEHNLTHNNLAWIQGQTPVDQDPKKMRKILDPIFKKNKYITCYNCKSNILSIPKFIKHLQMCKNNFEGRELPLLRDVSANDKSDLNISENLHKTLVQDDISTMKSSDDVLDNSKIINEVTCARCNNLMPRKEWNKHKIQHNNLAWNNEESSIDLKNKFICKKILDELVMQGEMLKCEYCNTKKKTTTEYFEHLENCTKIKDKCELTFLTDNTSIISSNELEKSSDFNDTAMDIDSTINESSYLFEATDVKDTTLTSDKGGDENDLNTSKKTREVKCAQCNELVSISKWSAHKVKHNNLAWNDEETPIDFNNRRLCENILQKLLKKNKYLKCEFCKIKKKSAVGFFSHYEKCNKSEEEILLTRAPCPICGRSYAKSSLPTHVYQVHNSSKTPSNQDKNHKDKVVMRNLNESRNKRHAASKALTLIEDLKKGVVQQNKTINDLFTSPAAVRIPNPVVKCWTKEISNSKDGKANCRNIPCTFRSSDIDELKSHYTNCNLHPKRGYWCTVCNFRSDVEDIMKEHVSKEHITELQKKIIDSDILGERQDKEFDIDAENESENDLEYDLSGAEWDDAVSGIEGQNNFQRTRGVPQFSFLLIDRAYYNILSRYYKAAKKWTLKFREKNYSEESLFCHLCNTTGNMVPTVLQSSYISKGGENSTMITYISGPYKECLESEDIAWKSYKKYEGFCSDAGIATIFCGGPVWGLAWCPLEEVHNIENEEFGEQFIAVTTHRSFDEVPKLDNSLNMDKKGVIQIWKIGVLDDEIEKCTTNPKLMYMIAHNYGAIWKLEWCPSGGVCEFEKQTLHGAEKYKRLGLLAVAASDGNVYIYSICLPKVSDSNEIPLFYQKPVAVLTMGHDMESSDHTTALSWTKEKGHNIIAAGFSSGFVAFWNLSTESPLLKHEYADMLCFHPNLIFKAHYTVISALVVFPYMDACYCFTASMDRSMQYWRTDTRSGSVDAFPLNGHFGKTNCITAAGTNIHWMAALVALDEAFGFGKANSSFFTLRDLTYKSTIVLNSSSLIWDIAACDWTNGFCQVTDGGELSAIYPHQLMAYIDSSKRIKKTRLMLGACLIRKLELDDNKEVLGSADNDTNTIIETVHDGDKNVIQTNKIIENKVKNEKNNAKKSVNKKKTNPKDKGKNLTNLEYDTKSITSWEEDLSDTEDTTSTAFDADAAQNLIFRSSYKDIVQDYGLVFYDFPTKIETNCKEYESQTVVAPNYPLNALTRVAYNPNKKCHSFIAVGMNAGFVRVRFIGDTKPKSIR